MTSKENRALADAVGDTIEKCQGLVLASHGILAVVELPDGRQVRCAQLRGEEYAIVGDRVEVGNPGNERPTVLRIEPRDHVLKRSSKGEVQNLAAHVDRLMVVMASVPPPREGLLDRFLVAASAARIPSWIIVNKLDLPGAEAHLESLRCYEALGYPLLPVSAESGRGLPALRELVSTGTSLLSGHSGVGKSSLLNALLGEDRERTGVISQVGRGRHTTTVAVAHRIGQGLLVDTPGVRSFSLAEIEPGDLRFCFPEMERIRSECQFADCLHLDEPGCAVRTGVSQGKVLAARYRSYRKLIVEIEEERVQERGWGKTRLGRH